MEPLVLPSPFFDSPGVTLFKADCMDILPMLEADTFDAVVTDPPYASGGRQQATARNTVSKADDCECRENDEWFLGDNMGQDTYIRWMRQVARECLRCVAHGGHGYVFTDWRQFTNLVTAWESVGWTLRNVIVWDKAKGGAMGSFWRNNHEWICVFAKGQPRSPAHRSCYNTWTGAKPQGHAHPTEKPMGLLNYIVGAIPKVSGLLLEPFAGSGTTLLAAAENGFRAVGIERSEAYAVACRDRLAQGLLFDRQNDADVGRRESDVPTSGLFDAIDNHVKRGGRMVFWTCPKGCRDIVDWNHDGGKSVATCRKCGASNASGEPRRASSRRVPPPCSQEDRV